MHALGGTPLTTNNVSFMKLPNQKCSYMGSKVAANEEYEDEMAAVIILAPRIVCSCASRSAGICWKRIQVFIEAVGPLSSLPQAR